jgi:hypothetical protein
MRPVFRDEINACATEIAPITAPTMPAWTAASLALWCELTGGACIEPKLLALAYAFGQATKRRRAASVGAVPPASAP